MPVRSSPGRGADGPSEPRVEVGRPQPPRFERAGPEVLAEDVGVGGEPADEVLATRRAQVDRHALAAAPLHRPVERVAPALGVRERADVAHEVPAAGLFDLHDFGALLAQQPGAERRRDPGAEVEHAEPGERPGHGSPACSRFTWSIPPALRSRMSPSAVRVLETNWWTMKWCRHESR